MKTSAAILVETGKPLVLDEVEIPALKAGQVLVKIAYSGVCHTQILEVRGRRGNDCYLPHCLGHEGSGTVLEAGPGVVKVEPGDRVILSWIKGSGGDAPRTTYQRKSQPVNSGAIATFMNMAVVSENRLTKINENISMKEAAFLGCAVATGAGAITNTASAKPGNSVAVFGAGGIGLCAISGAKAIGCRPVIAIDPNSEKLNLAKEMGASHTFNPSIVDLSKELAAILPDGLDIAIEASGKPDVMAAALRSVRPRGGTAVIIGNARYGQTVSIDPKELNMGKRLLGTWGGECRPDIDFPEYCKRLLSQKLNLKPLLEKSYSLNEINLALDDLESGKAARPLIEMIHGQ